MSNSLFLAVVNGRLDSVDRLLWAGANAEYEEDAGRLLDVAWNAGRKNEVAQHMYAHGWRFRSRKWVRPAYTPGPKTRIGDHVLILPAIAIVDSSP